MSENLLITIILRRPRLTIRNHSWAAYELAASQPLETTAWRQIKSPRKTFPFNIPPNYRSYPSLASLLFPTIMSQEKRKLLLASLLVFCYRDFSCENHMKEWNKKVVEIHREEKGKEEKCEKGKENKEQKEFNHKRFRFPTIVWFIYTI